MRPACGVAARAAAWSGMSSIDREPSADPPAPPRPATDPDESVEFVLELGRSLHALGYPSHWLEDALSEASRRLGLVGQFFVTPTSIFAAFGEGRAQHTHLLRLEGSDQQLERLTRVLECAREVVAMERSPASGTSRLRDLAAAAPRYGAPLTAAAFALSGAAACRFLGGGLIEVGAAAVLGAVLAAVFALAARVAGLGRVFPALASFLVSALAASAGRALGFNDHVSALAALLILLPGLAVTAAMAELSSQHLVSGTARILGAFTQMLAVAFGVAMGARVVEMAMGTHHAVVPSALPSWTEAAALLAAPLAFTVLMRAAPGDYVWILAVGASAHVVGRLTAPPLGAELAAFLAALTAGLLSHAIARVRQTPAAVTLVPSLLLLVPGSIGFHGLTMLIDRDIMSGVEGAFRMLLVASALVAGILLASALVPSSGLRGRARH